MSSKRPKIFHIIISPVIGGAERLLLTLAKESDKTKLDIILGIFTHRKNDLLLKESVKLGLTAEPIKIKNAYGFTQVLSLYKAIKKHRPDIIHTHGYKTNILGFFMAKLFRIPIITTFHGWGPLNKITTRMFYLICLKLLPYFNIVIAVSNQIRESLEMIGVPAQKLRTIRNIPCVTIQAPLLDTRALRDEFGISPKAKVVGFIGRLEYVKGCHQFIEAVKIVAERGSDTCFIIVGEGSERESLEHQVKKLGLKNRIYFCGFRHDMPSVFTALDLYVLSSLNEGVPLTLLEAMFYGIPVVATRVGGVPDVVQHGVNGLLVSSNAPQALAESIIESLSNRADTEQRVVEARKTVCREYSLDKWVDIMENLYIEVGKLYRSGNKNLIKD